MSPPLRARERGSALVATLLLGFAVAGSAAVLGHATYQLTAELRVRREALCARYAALAGLALGPSVLDQSGAVSESVDSLWVSPVRRAAQWCVIRSTARCGGAQRTTERTATLATCGG